MDKVSDKWNGYLHVLQPVGFHSFTHSLTLVERGRLGVNCYYYNIVMVD